MQGSRKKLCVSLFVCCAHLVHANDSLDPSSGGDIEYTGVCPCITTWSDIREEGSNGFGNPDGTLNAEVNDAMYIYPSFYGLEFCVDHDMRLPPVCNATDAGQTNATDWCSETWCYVDPDDCDLPDDDIQQSYYFPHIEELFFAYMDCAEDPAPPPVSPSYVLFPPPPPPTPPPNERGVCPYDRPYGRAMSARESKGLHQEETTSEVEWDWDFENNLDGDDDMKELQTEKGREVRRQEAGIALNGREAVSAGRSLDAFNRRRSFSSSRFSSSRFSGSRYSSRWSSGSRRRDSRRRTSSSTSYRRNSYVSTYRRRSNDFTTGVVAGVATYAALDYISSRRRFHQIIYLGASGRRRCVGGAYNYYGCHGYNPSISYRCCEGGYPDYCPDDSFDTARDEGDPPCSHDDDGEGCSEDDNAPPEILQTLKGILANDWYVIFPLGALWCAFVVYRRRRRARMAEQRATQMQEHAPEIIGGGAGGGGAAIAIPTAQPIVTPASNAPVPVVIASAAVPNSVNAGVVVVEAEAQLVSSADAPHGCNVVVGMHVDSSINTHV